MPWPMTITCFFLRRSHTMSKDRYGNNTTKVLSSLIINGTWSNFVLGIWQLDFQSTIIPLYFWHGGNSFTNYVVSQFCNRSFVSSISIDISSLPWLKSCAWVLSEWLWNTLSIRINTRPCKELRCDDNLVDMIVVVSMVITHGWKQDVLSNIVDWNIHLTMITLICDSLLTPLVPNYVIGRVRGEEWA